MGKVWLGFSRRCQNAETEWIISGTVAGIMPSSNCLAWEGNLGQDMVEV